MATADRPLDVLGQTPERARRGERPADSIRFDLAMVALIAWFIGGLFLDGWAHNNGRVDDTFLTPWHAVLYSGYAACGLLLVGTQMCNVFRGYGFLHALPRGYTVSLIGIIIFGAAGLFDFWWHETFGFEVGVEPLLSPAHLLLATGAIIFITGPLRAAWGRREAHNWRTLLPTVLSMLAVVSLLTFFTQYANFMGEPELLIYRPSGNTSHTDVLAVASFFIPLGILMSALLFALRRWQLPVGTVTLISTVVGFAMWIMNQRDTEQFPLLLLAPLAAGIVGDVLLAALKPSASPKAPLANRISLRVFAFMIPFVLVITYMFVLNQYAINLGRPGLWWSIHMWLGVPFCAAAIGVFLSYAAAPPALPDSTE